MGDSGENQNTDNRQTMSRESKLTQAAQSAVNEALTQTHVGGDQFSDNNEKEKKDTKIIRREHEVAIEATHNQLGEIRALEIQEAQERIQQIEDEETIIKLSEKGALSTADKVMETTLTTKFNINVSLMTPEEARGLYEWASDSSKDIKNEKAEIIDNVIERSLNGKRRRHDRGKYQQLEELHHKYALWERGIIDTSESLFDDSPYVPGAGEYFGDWTDESYSRADYDEEESKSRAYTEYDDESRFNQTIIQDFYDGYIDEEELQELIEDFDPGDMYVYGPFTRNDLEKIGKLSSSLYLGPTNWRVKSPLGRLLESSIPVRSEDIVGGLNDYYIGERILPNRRVGARDLVSMTASLGIESQDLLDQIDQSKKATNEENELRKNLGWCSYYLARICEVNLKKFDKDEYRKKAHDIDIPDDLIEEIEPLAEDQRENARSRSQNRQLKYKHGRAKPLSLEFYSEVLARSENWTDLEVEEKDATYNAYLIKLDEWLDRSEKAFRKLTGPDKDDNNYNEVPDVLSMINIGNQPQLPQTEEPNQE